MAVLTVYLFLLCALPSGLGFTALGSLGRPSTIWALLATVWWAWNQVQRHVPTRLPVQPVRIAFFCFAGVAFVSYAWAMIRGIPSDEVRTATNSLITILSWAGILLVANDGITDLSRLHVLLRRITLAGALLSLLGLLQFATSSSLIGWISIPGMSVSSPEITGLDARSGFIRASGTAMDPLEYGVVLCVALPIAIMLAVSDKKRSVLRRWTPVALIGAALALSISRSSFIGVVVVILLLLPVMSVAARIALVAGGAVTLIGVGFVVPGMLGTIVGLFTGLSSNPSTVSRANGLSMAAGFISHSPVLGKSFGTFLPIYYIYDDAYLLLATELGVAGLVAFLILIAVSMRSAWRARSLLSGQLDKQLAQSLVAATAVGAVLIAFFDGLSFPQAAGTLFLVFGICGALRRLGMHRRDEGRPFEDQPSATL